MSTPDNKFEQRVRGLWHEAAQRIDPATTGRLRAARRQALQSTQTTTARPHVRWLIPSGAFAAIALVAMLAWQPMPRDTVKPAGTVAGTANVATAQDNDLPPDADQVDPGLVQNLDFYSWLAANNSTPSNQ